MTLINAIREVQIPLLSAMLLGGCLTKAGQLARRGPTPAELGPAALFPVHLRRPAAALLCVIEFCLGVALIVTAGHIAAGGSADAARSAVMLFFIVAACALIELRGSRPDAGCGCFGDFSTTPVSMRTMARSVLLAGAALITIGLPPIAVPRPGPGADRLLAILAAEIVLIAMLSPEIGEGLVRLGYSDPCELRLISAERTLDRLLASSQWRRHAGLITADKPVDMWRELCWRYVVFPGRYAGRPVDVIFAVYLRQHRPAVQASVVDSATVEPITWPGVPRRVPALGRPAWRRTPAAEPLGTQPVGTQPAGAQPSSAHKPAGQSAIV